MPNRKFLEYSYVTTSKPTINNDEVDTANIGKDFYIGNYWLNTTDNSCWVCKDNATGVAVWERTDDAKRINGVFVDAAQEGDDGKILVYDETTNTFKYEFKGIYYSDYIEDEAESTTTDNINWQQKLRLSYTALKAGNYLVSFVAEFANSGANKGTEIRIEQDDAVELNFALTAPISANAYSVISGFKRVTLDDNPHTFDIDFKVEGGVVATAKIRRARIEIRKVA